MDCSETTVLFMAKSNILMDQATKGQSNRAAKQEKVSLSPKTGLGMKGSSETKSSTAVDN